MTEIRYQDTPAGIDRCPDCGAVVPPPVPLEGGIGTIAQHCEHKSWCVFRRRRLPRVVGVTNPGDPSSITVLEQPPAPGPIWTNGLAGADQPEPSYRPEQLDDARRELRRVAALMPNPRWILWALGYVTAGAARGPLSSTQLAMAAAVAEIDDWTTL